MYCQQHESQLVLAGLKRDTKMINLKELIDQKRIDMKESKKHWLGLEDSPISNKYFSDIEVELKRLETFMDESVRSAFPEDVTASRQTYDFTILITKRTMTV
ncbi:hypothetical protein UFOVP1634_28 [uncultured Caudovirales phage]|uniref:Uncharacterized protein n=1 Tax=uncultured Caudovirales phage TaxID=2100421 RepID=A0A6J5Q3E9_9CAUD|nr:hypothetical protein UFOVP1030_13 [uncultured Caudovirales phage]CAB4220414.1 hypothetical protein UFOVP1634_28 [uncultured Caudovirales phage]